MSLRPLALCAVLAGCSSAAEPLRLDYPLSEGGASMVLSIRQGNLRSVVALALGSGPPAITLPLAAEPAQLELEGAVYREPLQNLGIEAGELGAPAPGTEGSPLPGPSEVFTASPRLGETSGTWTKRNGLSSDLAAFRTRITRTAPDPCTTFTIRGFEVPPPGLTAAACLSLSGDKPRPRSSDS